MSSVASVRQVAIIVLTIAMVMSQPAAVVSVTAAADASLTVDVRQGGERATEVNALLIYQDRDWSEPYRKIENYPSVDLEHVFSNLPGGHEYLVSAYIQDQSAGNTGWIELDNGESVEREIRAETRETLTVRAVHDDGSTALEGARMRIESHEGEPWRSGTTGAGGYARTSDGGDDFYLYPPGDADDSSYYTVEIRHDGEVVGSRRIDALDRDRSIEIETSVPVTYDLSVSSTDGGYVDADQTGSIEAGTEVDLEANDDGDHAFDEWDGDVPAGVSESDDEITVTMDRDRDIEAEFAEEAEVSFEVMKASTVDGYAFSGEPVEDARITIDGVSQYTDEDGEVSFDELAPGTYPYTVRETGYETVTGTFELSEGGYSVVPVHLPRRGVGGLTVEVVDRDGNEVAANKYRVLADGERLELSRDGGVLLDEGTYDITVEPTDFGSDELVEVSKTVTVEAGEGTTVGFRPTQPRKPPIQDIEIDVLKINGNTEGSDGFRLDSNIDSIRLKVTNGEGQPVTTPTINLRLENEPEGLRRPINHQGDGVYTADTVSLYPGETQYLQFHISYSPSGDEASTSVPIINDFDPLVKPIPGWVPNADSGVTVTVDGQEYIALLMRRDGEYERDISGRDEKAWIVFDSEGRIVQNPEIRRKAALTAMVTRDTRQDGQKDVQMFREELPGDLGLVLTLGPVLEGTVIARDVLSQLLGAVIGAVASGGGNLAAHGGAKIAAKSTLKGATKETAKQFAKKFLKDYAKSQLSKAKLDTGDPGQLIRKGIKSESREEIKEAQSSSKTAGRILSDHIDGEKWSYTEAKRYRTAYTDLATDGYYYLTLYVNSYDQDVQTQIEQVTYNVFEGATGVPVTTMTEMIENGELGYISETNNETARTLAIERLRNRSYKEYSREAQQQALDSYGNQVLFASDETDTVPASIAISTEPSGTYIQGEKATTRVQVTNTGDRTKRFFVGYSVRTTVDGESKYFDNADSTGRFVTVSAGESTSIPVNWTAQPDAPVGKEYDVLVAVWPKFPGPDVQPLDRAERPNAFVLDTGTDLRGKSIDSVSDDPYANESIKIVATVSNERPTASTGVVNLTVGGTTVDNQIATIPGEQTETVTFSHTFDEPGQYVLKVAGHERRLTVLEREDSGPIARTNVVQSDASDSFIFDGSTSTETAAPISTYEWDFDGDGTIERTTSEPTTTHAYTSPGEYTAELTVTDDDGNTDTATTTVTVDADETDTVAFLDFQPENPAVGQLVSFDASDSTTAADTIEEYRWDFDGDGEVDRTTSEPTTTYAYAEPGRRTVELTVVDDAGTHASTSWSLQVVESEEDPDETIFETDFGSTRVGQYPDGWTKAGSNDQQVVDAPGASDDRALELSGSPGGCWEAIADRETEIPDTGETEISFDIRPTTNGRTGCHDHNTAVGLRTATGSWNAGNGYGLLDFRPDGTVVGSGVDLGSYRVDDWNDVTIRYTRSDGEVTLTYVINGERRATTTRDARSFEDALSYFRIKSGEFTTRLGDLSIERVADGPEVPGEDRPPELDGQYYLDVTAENASGVPVEGAEIVLYNESYAVLDRRVTDADANVTWSTLVAGEYNVELYGPDGAFWGARAVTVDEGGTATTIRRGAPHLSTITLIGDENGEGGFYGGRPITIGPEVRNDAPGSPPVRVQIEVDTDGDGTAERNVTRGDTTTTIPSGEIGYYGYEFDPSTNGTKRVRVVTQTVVDGNWTVTGNSSWTESFDVEHNIVGYDPQTERYDNMTTRLMDESFPSASATLPASSASNFVPPGTDYDKRHPPATGSYPWSAVGTLSFSKDPGYFCSASVVEDNHVITAAHCVYDQDTQSWRANQYLDLLFTPGQDHEERPIEARNVTHIQTYKGWVDDNDRRYDIAVLTLNESVESRTGTFGYENHSASSDAYRTDAHITGYPNDGKGYVDTVGEQWDIIGDGEGTDVAPTTGRELPSIEDCSRGNRCHDIATGSLFGELGAEGMSGGPIWQTDSASNGPTIVSIYSGNSGVGPAGDGIGIRISEKKYSDIGQMIARGNDRAPVEPPADDPATDAFVERFEDDTLTDWNDVEAASITTDTVYEGGHSAVITDRNEEMFRNRGHYTGNRIVRTGSRMRPSTLGAAVRVSRSSYNDLRVRWRNETGAVVHAINLDERRNDLNVNGRTVDRASPSTWYYVELAEIDWENDVIGEVRVDGEVVATDVGFQTPSDAVSNVSLSVNAAGTGARAWFDEVTVPRSVSTPPDEPSSGGSSSASATGDPHLTTFDGVSYDFQAAGEFVLARDGSLAVQARLRPVSNRQVSVVSAVATRVDGRSVTVDARDSDVLTVDGEAQSLAPGESFAVGDGRIARDGRTYTVVYPGADEQADPDDERLAVDVRSNRVDVTLTFDEARGSDVGGLLGSPDGNASNDVAYANGTALSTPASFETLYGAFRDDYRVTSETSLFDYDAGESPSTFFDADYPSERVTVADLDPQERQRARQQARDAGLEPGTPEFADAVLDFGLTNDPSYIDSAEQAANATNATVDATPAPSETLVVAPGSAGDYAAIDAAVENASAGTTVEVRPGTYHGTVDLSTSVTLVAPNGATLDGGASRDHAVVRIASDAAPTVEGITIHGSDAAGVAAVGTAGDWTLRNVTISGTAAGVDATRATGDWTIRNATVRNTNGTAVTATDTTGAWSISESALADNDRGLNATGAAPTGTASHNWWGAPSGPGGRFAGAGDAVVGNVSVNPYYADAARTTTATVAVPSTGPANLTVAPPSLPANVTRGTTLNASVTVTNVGGRPADQSVEFRLDVDGDGTLESTDLERQGRTNVTLTSGDRRTLQFEAYTDGLSPGAYRYGVFTVNDSHTGVVNVTRPPRAAATVTFDDATVVNGTRTVRVDRANYTGGSYYVVIHAEASSGDGAVDLSTPLGNSTELASGPHEDVTVDLAPVVAGGDRVDALVRDRSLVAVIHRADPGANAFGDAVSVDGTPAADTAAVDVRDVSQVTVGPARSDATFDSIPHAVDSVREGGTVVLRPGTYETQVRLDRNVTLAAPDGAVLDGRGIEETVTTGVIVTDEASPTVSGLTVRGFDWGVSAQGSVGDWTVENVTIRNTDVGVQAAGATGAWTISDSTIVEQDSEAVQARRTTGDWSVTGTRLRDSAGVGVEATRSTGDWTVAVTTIRDTRLAGIEATRTEGDWRVRGVTVRNTTDGIDATRAAGDWRVRDVTVRNVVLGGVVAADTTGDWAVTNATLRRTFRGVNATRATGAWRVTESRFENNGLGLDARGAASGSATRNWWGAADGPGGPFGGGGDAARGTALVRPFYTDAALTALSTPVNASVTFDDATVVPGTTTVRVDHANYTGSPYVVVVSREPADGEQNRSAVGVSAPLAPGEHADVPVDLGATLSANDTLDALDANATLVARLHRAAPPGATYGEATAATSTAAVTVERPTITVAADSVTAVANGTATVSVRAVDVTDAVYFAATVSYDPTVGNVTDVVVPGIDYDPTVTVDDEAGTVRFQAQYEGRAAPVANLTFDLVARTDTSTPIRVTDATVYVDETADPTVETADGRLTVVDRHVIVSNTTLDVTTVRPGGTVAVNATLTNPTSVAGPIAIPLRANGSVVTTLTRPLPADGNTTVQFTYTPESAGTRTLAVGDGAGRTLVVAAVDVAETNTTTRVSGLTAPDTPLSASLNGTNGAAAAGVFLDRLNVSTTRQTDVSLEVNVSTAPDGVPALDGAAAYIDVGESAPEEAFDTVTFTFRVDADRLSDPATAELYRYHGGAWSALETTYLGTVDGQYRFRAVSPGLSVFAVRRSTDAVSNGDSALDDDSTPDDADGGADSTVAPSTPAPDGGSTPASPGEASTSAPDPDATPAPTSGGGSTPADVDAPDQPSTAASTPRPEPGGVDPRALAGLALLVVALGGLWWRRR